MDPLCFHLILVLDYNWLTEVFKLGVLDYFDVVSLHPYRQGGIPGNKKKI